MTGTDWFLALTIVFFAALLAHQLWRDCRRGRGDAIRVDAVITGHERETDSDGDGLIYRACYRFTAPDGKVHETVDPMGSGEEPAVGKRLSLAYLPGAPHRAEPATVTRIFWNYAMILPLLAILIFFWCNGGERQW